MQNNYTVSTFYKFINIDDVNELQITLIKHCKACQLKGTILVAEEGVNGTLAGSEPGINQFERLISSIYGLENMEFKRSISKLPPFKRIKVIVKKEIVTFKVDDLDLNNRGEYLSGEEWDKILLNPETIVVDTRNDYEIAFGTFQNAIDPQTKNFSDLPEWVDRIEADVSKDRPVAMFCTGGVRCEKSTAYMKQRGFTNVYHLKGGILQYLDETKNKNQLWNGSCFVFDDRLTLDENLKSTEEL
jgi:UPF0176 protein